MLSLAVLVTCIFKCQAIGDYGTPSDLAGLQQIQRVQPMPGTADVYDLLIQKQDGVIGVSRSHSSLGARTVELLRSFVQSRDWLLQSVALLFFFVLCFVFFWHRFRVSTSASAVPN